MINGHAEQKQVYDGRTEVAVRLPVNTWNNILTVIADAPWKIADPLMTEIRRQITETLEGGGHRPDIPAAPRPDA